MRTKPVVRRKSPPKNFATFVEKPAYTLKELLAFHAGSRSKLYEEIKGGRLKVRKQGRTTVVLLREYIEFLENLPLADPSEFGVRPGGRL